MNTNDEGMKYSPCKNSETEQKVRQQHASLLRLGKDNQNIVLDCLTASQKSFFRPAVITASID